MKFYNSLNKQLEEFTYKKDVSIYSCGPTVYDYAHIGNLRTFLFEDLLIRTLKSQNINISHTRNITDVDDKTIKHSQNQNISLKEFTQKFRNAFLEDLASLSFDQTSTKYLNATEYIQQMIDLIQELINKGFAYQTEDGVYFKSNSFAKYGDFEGLDLTNIQSGASGSNIDFTKEDIGDFVIWKGYKNSDGDVYWDSPWGKGRPGWHTECAAMVNTHYPEGVDIHTGGIDLLFPHHTNEKAHCECINNKPMARFWLHATHLLVDNKKMSKSLGNFFTARDLIARGFEYKTIRFYLLTGAHYRSPLNFTLEGLKGAETALKRLNNFIHELYEKPQNGENTNLLNKFNTAKQEGLNISSDMEAFLTTIHEKLQNGENTNLLNKFNTALHEDLNISGAMGEIFTVVHDYYLGRRFFDTKKLLEDLQAINQILAVLEFPSQDILDNTTQELFDLRVIARQQKNWAESDRLRDELLKYGIEVRDTKDGTTIRKI